MLINNKVMSKLNFSAPEDWKKFFIENLKKDQDVLEWGSGASTPVIAERVKSVLSIEHNLEWYNKVSSNLPSNGKVVYTPTKYPHDWRKDGDGNPDNFEDYINYPLDKGKFDLIFIDGRARVTCASVCSKICKDDTIILVDDFTPERIKNNNYGKMYEYFDLIEQVGALAKFKVKS
jgi:hypothetical protein